MIDEKRILETYRKGTPEERELLMRLMDPSFIEEHITEIVQSYEDAVKMVGDDLPLSVLSKMPKHLQAQHKLEVITKALNCGWRHPQDGETWCYYVWGRFYDKEEIAKMSQEDKDKSILVRLGGSAHDGAYCGLAFLNSLSAFSSSSAYLGSRLAYKTWELAEYSAQQFRDLWAETLFYLPVQEDEEEADK